MDYKYDHVKYSGSSLSNEHKNKGIVNPRSNTLRGRKGGKASRTHKKWEAAASGR